MINEDTDDFTSSYIQLPPTSAGGRGTICAFAYPKAWVEASTFILDTSIATRGTWVSVQIIEPHALPTSFLVDFAKTFTAC